MPNYDYILFDADNTLFDFDAAEHAALTATLERYGYANDDTAREHYLRVNRELWAAFNRGEVTADFLLVERFAALQRLLGGGHDPAEMNAFYLDRLGEGADLLPGAEELCRALAPHCTLAIITNGVPAVQRSRIAGSPLDDLFPHLFISGEMGAQKPEWAFFQKVFHTLGITSTARTVVVGDSLSADIQGAANAGLPSIWYNPKGLPSGDGPQPTYIAAQFSTISAIILD